MARTSSHGEHLAVTALAGVGDETATRLLRLGIATVGDLLTHYPRRYEDWTAIREIAYVRIDEDVILKARVVSCTVERSPRKRLAIVRALIRDDSGEMLAVWFGQAYLTQTLVPDTEFYFKGRVGYDRAAALKQLTSPTIERTPRIVPIYPETAGITSRQLHTLIERALKVADRGDPLSDAVVHDHQLLGRFEALEAIHSPGELSQIVPARRRFAFEELLAFSLGILQMKEELSVAAGPVCRLDDASLRRFTDSLPFRLTDGQRRAAWEIIQNLGSGRPMNRLVEGDVGSGKTVVAAFAAYVAALSGYQVMWMAPTEILASQHAVVVAKLLESFAIPVHIWTGSKKSYDLTNAEPVVLIGTQALLSGKLTLPKLGLVIVDEQHRFGVAQRKQLKDQTTHLNPHFLSMTATPIPRTLALALYGDLDVSIIGERPEGRQPIATKVVAPDGRPAAYGFIREQVALGRQVFVVCPLVEPGEGGDTLFADLEKKSAIAEYERLGREIFPDLRIGLVHGKLRPREKQAVMEAFRTHALDLLVSTAVIEVGIDVPNATVMFIEGAERFGLAQLHQLRGRVGRGAYQSYCYLLTEVWSDKVATRLRAMEETDNGFRLAETDLALRGPGEFLGSSQSGLPQFKLASLIDLPLIHEARQAALVIMRDPGMAAYRARVALTTPDAHLE